MLLSLVSHCGRPGLVCPKSIHNFSIPELGETYLTLHQEHPNLKEHTLDTRVPEFLELPIKFF